MLKVSKLIHKRASVDAGLHSIQAPDSTCLISSPWVLLDYEKWLLLVWNENLQPHPPGKDNIGHPCLMQNLEPIYWVKVVYLIESTKAYRVIGWSISDHGMVIRQSESWRKDTWHRAQFSLNWSAHHAHEYNCVHLVLIFLMTTLVNTSHSAALLLFMLKISLKSSDMFYQATCSVQIYAVDPLDGHSVTVGRMLSFDWCY